MGKDEDITDNLKSKEEQQNSEEKISEVFSNDTASLKTYEDYAVKTFDAIPLKSSLKKHEFIPPDSVIKDSAKKDSDKKDSEKKDSEKKDSTKEDSSEESSSPKDSSEETGEVDDDGLTTKLNDDDALTKRLDGDDALTKRLDDDDNLTVKLDMDKIHEEKLRLLAEEENWEEDDGKIHLSGRVIFRIAAAAAVLIAAIICLIYFKFMASPGFSADSKMKLVHEHGVYTLSWDISKIGKVDKFVVEVYDGARIQPIEIALKENPDQLIYSADYSKTDVGNEALDAEISLPGASIKGKKAIIYVNTEKTFNLFGKEVVKRGRTPMIAKVAIDEAADYNLVTDIDPDSKRLSISSSKCSAETYSVFVKSDGNSLSTGTDAIGSDGAKLLTVADVTDGDRVQADIYFGTQELSIPYFDETYTFNMVGQTDSGSLTFVDLDYKPISLDRQQFLSNSIVVNVTDDGKNRYTFTWNETKGDGYKISVWNEKDQDWNELKTYVIYDNRTYTTEKLKPCIDTMYKVEAVLPPDKANSVTNQELTIHTNPSVEFATVWPTMELPVYKNSTGEDKVGTVSALHAMTVLDEKDGRFYVKTGMGKKAEEGYIDSSKCFVNLPDYIGDLCLYNITNSYCSIFTAHEYAIPDVSGTTVEGYENVLLADSTFLVPVLYPVAQKLVPAAEKARQQGYALKIYDSFRPHVATKSLYSLTFAALDYVVPADTFSKVSLSKYMDGKSADVLSTSDLKKAEEKNEAKEEQTTEKKSKKKSKKKKKTEEETTEATTAAPAVDANTYSNVMLDNGAYSLDNFLASGDSAYNYGIALDITLVKLEDGKELDMQTKMHDLSYNSVVSKNNENANFLKEIMTSAGFTTFANEWWHFQDASAKENGAVSVENGVSVEGWKKDDRGWRYRLQDGSYFKDTKEKIGDKTYTFDIDGYTDID